MNLQLNMHHVPAIEFVIDVARRGDDERIHVFAALADRPQQRGQVVLVEGIGLDE